MTQRPAVAAAMDWGGTWARVALADREGKLIWRDRARNQRRDQREALLASGEALLGRALDFAEGEGRRVVGLGVAVAGPVEAATGTLFAPPHLPGLDGVSLKAQWEPRFKLPVWIGNDATLAALGEYRFGACRQMRESGAPPRLMLYLTVSTGIGGGAVIEGQVLQGAHGLAAEFGHMALDWRAEAPRCPCGRRGCLEALASGTAIARLARERLAQTGEVSRLRDLDGFALNAEAVFHAAAQGDALAGIVVDDACRALATGIANLLHVFNPDLVVLGGGVTQSLTRRNLLPRIHALATERAISPRYGQFQLLPSALQDNAGLVGAAAQVWQEAG